MSVPSTRAAEATALVTAHGVPLVNHEVVVAQRSHAFLFGCTAFEFAERDELASPGAWIAASAGWSGGSLAPRGYDPIPPPEHLPAEAAVAALRFVAARKADYATAINGFVVRALQLFGSAATRTARTTGTA